MAQNISLYLTSALDITIFPSTLTQDQKQHLCVPMENFNGKVAFGRQTGPSSFLNLMFKLFFQYLAEFLVFWMDDLLIYIQTEEEHLKHLELVFEKFREASIKLKMSKCEFFKKEIEYLGHLVSGQGISPMK